MDSPKQALYICLAASNRDNKTLSCAGLTARAISQTKEGVVLIEPFAMKKPEMINLFDQMC
jgi:hypothetical protein